MRLSEIVAMIEALEGNSHRPIDRDQIIELGKFALELSDLICWVRDQNKKLTEDCDKRRAELDGAKIEKMSKKISAQTEIIDELISSLSASYSGSPEGRAYLLKMRKARDME